MQKIRLNPGLKRIHSNNPSVSIFSATRTALPLPGPPLGNYSFPQEAYFEVTVLHASGADDYEWNGKNKKGESIKLIQHNSNSKGNHIEVMRDQGKEEGKREPAMFSVGLTTGRFVPSRAPGSYAGSIGFNSNGSVYLEGTKLVMESEKVGWVESEKVIGCRYDPRLKKVFFTMGSELVHVIQCYSEEFETPLYPTLAANIDMTVLVNFGQCAFKYGAANAQRTLNPCFIAPLVNNLATATLGYEDSKELFSIGRIDSQWLNVAIPKGSHFNNGVVDLDYDSEADLFEIVLDRSQNVTSSPF
ncbi:protein SSH4-like [Prosopis cineraria]|uniref:protein SSH4-like n=1 Tax=Prosopis cineraria TaxID=364024 RepID=UPI00240FC69E|nr:protein SSH4-like [Prosopis cineraria]